jgi:hypothetical protein
VKSKVSLMVPIEFSVSGTCLAVSSDFACLTIDVGLNLIHSHRGSSERWPPFEQYQETVTTLIGDVEFRDLLTERRMGKAEFAGLMGLVVGTARRLFEVAKSTGFESAILRGVYNGVAFKVWWTWYSFVNGVAGPCKEVSLSATAKNCSIATSIIRSIENVSAALTYVSSRGSQT